MRAAMEEGDGDWQQGKGLTQTQRMTINAALRNATMQTEGLASVVRALVDATEIRIHRTRSFVAVWDKERGRMHLDLTQRWEVEDESLGQLHAA